MKAEFSTIRSAAVIATRASRRGWIIFPATIAAYLLYRGAMQLFAPTGLFGAVLIGIVGLLLVTLIYGWLRELHRSGSLGTEDLLRLDGMLLSRIVNVGFILFPVNLIADALVGHNDSRWLGIALQFVVFLIANVASEIVIREEEDGWGAVVRSYHFIVERWWLWFLPYLLILPPILGSGSGFVGALVALSGQTPFLPTLFVVPTAQLFVSLPPFGMLLGVAGAVWLWLFRLEWWALLGRRGV